MSLIPAAIAFLALGLLAWLLVALASIAATGRPVNLAALPAPAVSRGPSRRLAVLAFSLIVLILGSLPLVAHCAEPTPAPAFRYVFSSLDGTTFLPGKDKKLLFGARADAALRLPLGAQLLGRLDASALSDGGALNVTFEDPSSFTTIEGTLVLTRPVLGPAPLTNSNGAPESSFGPAIGYGWTVPFQNGRPEIIERYPRTWLVGLMARIGDSWFLAGGGVHEASGLGGRLLFAGEIATGERTAVGADGAFGAHSFLRTYLLVRIGGSR